MRRLALILCVSLALAGCGSSGSSGSSNPLGTGLSYFPAGTPFVMSITTDPNAPAVMQMHALESRIPLAGFAQAALMAKLDQLGIDYTNDIRPLFGNPLIAGFTAAGPGLSTGQSFLVAWVTKDAGKLGALVKKITGGKSAGTHDGAALYALGRAATVAVDGATAILGGSVTAVDAALDRHAHGGGLTNSQFSSALSSLPQDALLQAYGNLSGVLSQPNAAKARRVPWVAAIRGYAATMSATSAGLNLSFRIDTTGRSLTASQLPLAPGSTAPAFAANEPITVGIENPAHILSFIESAAQATGSAGFSSFLARQAALKRRTGTDVADLLRLLSGHLIVASDTHTTMGRATLSDPAAGARILARLMSDPKATFLHSSGVRSLGGGFYSLGQHGGALTVGVASGQLVAGKASPAQLRAFAASPTAPASGANGPVAFRIAIVELLHLVSHVQLPAQASTILNSLGDITGWASDTTRALTGSATLAIR